MGHVPCPFASHSNRNRVPLRWEARSGSRLQEATMADDDRKTDGMKNQGEGMIDQVKGRVRNTVGGITGDTSEQIKGKAQELKGKAQRKIGEKQVDLEPDD